jgi:hypothetical protein
MTRSVSRLLMIGAMSVCLTTSVQAASVTFEMNIEYTGAFPPTGAAPWLTATFDDGGSAGSVELTLEATNLTNPEFVFQWLFNLAPALDPNDLVFSAPTRAGQFIDPAINLGVDSFQAAGDGYFDIQFAFNHTNGPSNKFGAGDAATYTITGIASLTADSFDLLSAPGGGHGPFPTAAHVGGINDANSGWVSVPEPSALSLSAFGALALLRRRR